MRHRGAAAVLRTIDATLPSAVELAGIASLASRRWSRRTRAKVLLRLVSKLAKYRKEGSRIDFIGPRSLAPTCIDETPTRMRRQLSTMRAGNCTQYTTAAGCRRCDSAHIERAR